MGVAQPLDMSSFQNLRKLKLVSIKHSDEAMEQDYIVRHNSEQVFELNLHRRSLDLPMVEAPMLSVELSGGIFTESNARQVRVVDAEEVESSDAVEGVVANRFEMAVQHTASLDWSPSSAASHTKDSCTMDNKVVLFPNLGCFRD